MVFLFLLIKRSVPRKRTLLTLLYALIAKRAILLFSAMQMQKGNYLYQRMIMKHVLKDHVKERVHLFEHVKEDLMLHSL